MTGGHKKIWLATGLGLCNAKKLNVPFQAAVLCDIVYGSVASCRAYSGADPFELKRQQR